MAYQVIATLPVSGGNILRDELIVLSTPAAAKDYPDVLRRITALVEVDGREQEMVFLTNNMAWSPASVADLWTDFENGISKRLCERRFLL